MSKYLKPVLALLMLIFLYLTFYYHYEFSRHSAIAELTSISDARNLVFTTQAGDQLQVKAPAILVPLLEIHEKYAITVYRNNFRKPFLKSIHKVPVDS